MNRRQFLKKMLSTPVVAAAAPAVIVCGKKIARKPDQECKGDFYDYPLTVGSHDRYIMVFKKGNEEHRVFWSDQCSDNWLASMQAGYNTHKIIKLAPGEKVKSGNAVFWNDDGTVRRVGR
jgi:hypothetical protein